MYSITTIILSLSVVLLWGISSDADDVIIDNPIADTIYGTVMGQRKVDDKGRVYDEYLGIPFATPPVGNLRWKKPQPPSAWEGVYNATSYGAHCVHTIAIFYPLIGLSNETSEDCLYLNVIVPITTTKKTGFVMPVMVWIYGGAYLLGTTAMYPTKDLSLHGDVITVSISYRLGTLGWMTTGDEVSPGNFGLWDIQAGLSWVSANIDRFGGDPSRTTVFGQSAGGALTSHTLVSPHTANLFQRGIAISGTSSGFFGTATLNSSVASTEMLGRRFLCGADTSQEIFDCLMQEDPFDLNFWGVVGVVTARQQLPNWMPVIDGLFMPADQAFVPQEPRKSWEGGASANFDMITGRAFTDSALFVLGSTGTTNRSLDFGVCETQESLERFLRFVTNIYGNPNATIDAMFEQYPNMETDDPQVRVETTTQATTDWWFGSGAHFEAGEHSRWNPSSYLYEFKYDQSFLFYPDFVQGSHLDDIYSVLGEPFGEIMVSGAEFSEVDLQVSNDIMSYYTNFAHSGNPNVGPNPVAVEWPQYVASETGGEYMELSAPCTVRKEDSTQLDNFRFWNEAWHEVAIPRDPCGPRDDLCEEQPEPTKAEEIVDEREAIGKFESYLFNNFGQMLDEYPEVWDQIEVQIEKTLSRLDNKREAMRRN